MNRLTATIILIILGLAAKPLSAEQFGLFTYGVLPDNTIQITDYPEDATGEVIIPSEIEGRTVSYIGLYAFSGCTGLTSVTIPGSVTSIGGWAFSGCTGLTSVSIPEGVTIIKSYAFGACAGLPSVSIPSSVSTIGDHAFGGCSGRTSIVVAPGNPDYASADGVLFNAEMTRLVRFPEGKPGNYTIPEGVTYISDFAFSGCIGLTSVSIPEGVTAIGGAAFMGCSGLTSITIPSSVTEVEGFAFGNTRLQSLVFSGDSPRFAGCTFYGASSPAIRIQNLVIVPHLAEGHLSIRYDPSYRGLSYRVETSRDLVHWTEEEVSWSEWGPDGLVTASVPMDGPTRFLRLVPYIKDNCNLA